MTDTDNHNLNRPAEGTTDWHVPLNENFGDLDSAVEIRDIASERSTYTPKQGAKFLATDTGEVFLGDGSSWVPIGGFYGDLTDVVRSSSEPNAPDSGYILWLEPV